MDLDRRHPSIVETRPPHRALVEIEAERLDEMQRRTRVGAESDDIAGVGRDLRLEEDDTEHRLPIAQTGVSNLTGSDFSP